MSCIDQTILLKLCFRLANSGKFVPSNKHRVRPSRVQFRYLVARQCPPTDVDGLSGTSPTDVLCLALRSIHRNIQLHS